jgi:hypothetical protein
MIEMSPSGNESRMRRESARARTEPDNSGFDFIRANSRLAVALIAVLAAIGCRSRVIKISLTNASAQSLSAIIVDYPGATFGVNTLEPGKTFQYTIKPLDSGALKIQFADANGKIHNVTGPVVAKGQEGAIEIKLTQDSAVAEPAAK